MSEREPFACRDTGRAEIRAAERGADGWFVGEGAYPVRFGNAVRPLVDGEAAFRRICEAAEAARLSVWTTVAFLRDGFAFPGGKGSFFEVLDRAAERGVDVRVVFWRPSEEMVEWRRITFWGSDDHRAHLATRGSQILARWDRSPSNSREHQKSWLIDAGHDRAVAFVGGINPEPALRCPVGASRSRGG
jgi:cardiolipin synthase A/B